MRKKRNRKERERRMRKKGPTVRELQLRVAEAEAGGELADEVAELVVARGCGVPEEGTQCVGQELVLKVL